MAYIFVDMNHSVDIPMLFFVQVSTLWHKEYEG